MGGSFRAGLVSLLLATCVGACTDPIEGVAGGDSSTGGAASTSQSGDSTVSVGTTDEDASGPEVTSTSTSSTGEPPGTDDSTGDPPDDHGDPFDPVPPFEPMDPTELAELQGQLDAILGTSAAGPAQSVLIVDLENDEIIYEKSPDAARVPASNTKLVTTGSSIDILGPDHRMLTEVRAAAGPDAAGVVTGDVYLMGDHDFTWSTFFYPSARIPLDYIAQQLYDEGVRQITGAIVARGDFCYEGQSLGTFDAATHRAVAVARFGDALTAAGITVTGGSQTEAALDPPAGTQVLTQWWSPPISSASFRTNVHSNNEFADIALRHLGWHLANVSDYTAGAAEMLTWMAGIPTDTTNVAWFDGSGLDHGNRTSARNLVELIDFMTEQPHGEAWLRTMSVSGVRGTLGSRMTGADTYGRFFGKTGSLPSIGVSTLSGVLYHRHDGRRYAVSILLNSTPDSTVARTVQDEVVEALAVDHRAAGPRPDAVTLQAAVGDVDSDVVELVWSAVPDVDGYVVWLSPDGYTWSMGDARLVAQPQHRAGDLPFSPTYVRVTALYDVPGGPLHAPASDVYAARSGREAASILIVDGNDRWQDDPVPENPRGRGHDFVVVHAAAISDDAFDAADNDAVLSGVVDLASYAVVIWALGEESVVHETFSVEEQAEVASYLGSGGTLFVSGAELGYDLGGLGSPADAAFLADVLGASYVGDDADSYLAGAGSGVFTGLQHIGFLTAGEQSVDFPDQFAPAGGASTVLSYRGGAGGAAAVERSDGAAIVLGFPFESIDNAADRAEFMARVLDSLLSL